MSLAHIRNLIIGGVEIPFRSLTNEFRQDYEEITGVGELPMDDGSLVIIRLDQGGRNYRLRTTISGGGIMPAPLDALDRGTAVDVECAEPRRIGHPTTPTSLTITLPAGRRSGGIYTPRAFALVVGETVETPIVEIVDHVATLTAVSGAQHYHVQYYPKFTGRLEYRHSGEPWQARRSWSVTLREV